MATVYAIHDVDADKLATVTVEMETMGAPSIRVINCGDHFMALEGSHRLAAAKALGLTPDLIIIEHDDEIDISVYDWFEAQNWDNTVYQAGEVAGELFSPWQAVPYSFA